MDKIECLNLNADRTLNVIQNTKNSGEIMFPTYNLGSSYLGDCGSGKITKKECVVSLDQIFTESIEGDGTYIVKFYPLESCEYKIEKQADYFTITADKNIEFGWEVMGLRKGHSTERFLSKDDLVNSI